MSDELDVSKITAKYLLIHQEISIGGYGYSILEDRFLSGSTEAILAQGDKTEMMEALAGCRGDNLNHYAVIRAVEDCPNKKWRRRMKDKGYYHWDGYWFRVVA